MKIGRFGLCLVSATIAGVSGIVVRDRLAAFGQGETPDLPVRRRRRLPHGNAKVRHTLLPEFPDITLYIDHLRSRISNEPLEEVRLARPLFLPSLHVS